MPVLISIGTIWIIIIGKSTFYRFEDISLGIDMNINNFIGKREKTSFAYDEYPCPFCSECIKGESTTGLFKKVTDFLIESSKSYLQKTFK